MSTPSAAAPRSTPNWSATDCRATPITSPRRRPTATARCAAWRRRFERAGIAPAEIDYINAHGTSTPIGDEIELGAVQRLVGNAAGRMSMSSTKSSIGHLLGAAGAVEAIFSILAIRDGIVPPTLNLDNPSVETSIDLVPHQPKKRVDRRGAVEFVRVRRHQCVAGVPARRRIRRGWLQGRAFCRIWLAGQCARAPNAGQSGRGIKWAEPEASANSIKAHGVVPGNRQNRLRRPWRAFVRGRGG